VLRIQRGSDWAWLALQRIEGVVIGAGPLHPLPCRAATVGLVTASTGGPYARRVPVRRSDRQCCTHRTNSLYPRHAEGQKRSCQSSRHFTETAANLESSPSKGFLKTRPHSAPPGITTKSLAAQDWRLQPGPDAPTVGGHFAPEVKGTNVSPISKPVARQRARVAALSRHGADDDELAKERQELKFVSAEDWVKRAIADAPPLTDEQRTKLAELLKPVRRKMVTDPPASARGLSQRPNGVGRGAA
jgi:hypothetical protein